MTTNKLNNSQKEERVNNSACASGYMWLEL